MVRILVNLVCAVRGLLSTQHGASLEFGRPQKINQCHPFLPAATSCLNYFKSSAYIKDASFSWGKPSPENWNPSLFQRQTQILGGISYYEFSCKLRPSS